MKESLKLNYDEGNDIFGFPQIYKSLKLYPIKIKDQNILNLFYRIMAHSKNYIPDVNVLKMSYLKFVIYVIASNMNIELEKMADDIKKFMEYITKDKVEIYVKDTNFQGIDSFNIIMKIGDIEFNEFDFDNIREIVLEQNGLSIEYIEEYEPSLEESLNFMNRESRDLTFLDEIFTFSIISGITLKQLEDYTIFQFKNSMEKIMILKEFDLYKPLVVSGQIELKSGEVKHYLFHSAKNGRYDSIKMDENAFKKKYEDAENSSNPNS